MGSLQEGIYYKKGHRAGKSLGIIFLRVNKSYKASQIGDRIFNIWKVCSDLKKGMLGDFRDLKITYPKLYEDLTVMIGFSPGIFDLEGAHRKKPLLFSEESSFRHPFNGGGELISGSDLLYQQGINENPMAFDDVVIQFISESPFVTNQCVVEVWHEISQAQKDENSEGAISISRYYDGFGRSDKRSLIGFHDGVSNLTELERKEIIAINQSQVKPEDNWTVEGTFMAFIRMYVDLRRWWDVERNLQEIMVGRDKATGCPIIGVDDTTGKNIVIKGCPVLGTKEVLDKGNEKYRNHPPYGFQNLPPSLSDGQLKFSHIGQMRRIERQNVWKKEQYRIFRQGYEFLEKANSHPGLTAGLNFICFQDNPTRLFKTLHNKPNANEASVMNNRWSNKKQINQTNLKFNDFFKVGSAGIFFVPPVRQGEKFPGASIFFSDVNVTTHSHSWKR